MTTRSLTGFAGFMLAWLVGMSIAHGAPSASDIAQLGTTLTPFGAEKAGNREGTIPPYTGGLPVTTNPTGFQPGSGRWSDPYADEKPLFSITAKNMAAYANQLSETSKHLLTRDPDYRMDIYPSHRSVAYPPGVLENTLKNAGSARLDNGGLSLEGAMGGIPFPLPKTGQEVMWNHLLRYNGLAYDARWRNWYVSANGRPVNSSEVHLNHQNLYFNPGWTSETLKKNGNFFNQYAYDFTAPSSIVGNATVFTDTLDPVDQPRRAWTYSASTRRTRVAPELAYDTPIASQGGVMTYDEVMLYEGSLEQFDFKLIGKREMFLPYNGYGMVFQATSSQLLTPKHLNPDHVRWELHRVWVVEATLKPGKRHTFTRRVFYFDEDLGGAGMSDAYTANGQLAKGLFLTFTQLYDQQLPLALCYWGYDLNSGIYALGLHPGDPGHGFTPKTNGLPALMFTPDALPARGGR